MEVTLQYFEGCPHWQVLEDRLIALRDDHKFDLVHQIIDTAERATEAHFVGSPTVLIDGLDPFAQPGAPVGLSCRIFSTPDGPAGSPTFDQLRHALETTPRTSP